MAQGADKVFNHRSKGYQEEILEFTGGNGVDYIMEMLANENLVSDLKVSHLLDLSCPPPWVSLPSPTQRLTRRGPIQDGCKERHNCCHWESRKP